MFLFIAWRQPVQAVVEATWLIGSCWVAMPSNLLGVHWRTASYSDQVHRLRHRVVLIIQKVCDEDVNVQSAAA